jgi:hypothetical protein
MPALRDPRAIRIEGKPVFMIYQARDLPEPARTAETWRREVRKAGIEDIYLMTVETGWDAEWDATQEGFDAKVLFMPQFSILRTTPRIPLSDHENVHVYDYQKAWPILADPDPVPYTRYDTVFPSWDNSARAGDDAVIVHDSTPEAYEQWLRHAVAKAQQRPRDQQMVFVNAWNEWAEGAHLEPDMLHGRAYLEATRQALLPPRQRTNLQYRERSVSDARQTVLSGGPSGGSSGGTPVGHVAEGSEKRLQTNCDRIEKPSSPGKSEGSERLFAEGAQGVEDAPWIAKDTKYEFRLYTDTKHKTLLAAVTVLSDRNALRTAQLQGEVQSDGPFIAATPNPVPVHGKSVGTTKVAWSTGDGSWGQVYLSTTQLDGQ